MTTQQVTVITGASSGIGAALTRLFAENGHRLVLVARRADPLQTLANSLSGMREAPMILPFDLEKPEAAGALQAALKEAGVSVQFLVNNAGFGCLGALVDQPAAAATGMVDVNMRAVTDLCHRFLPDLEANRGGILNVASVAGFFPRQGMAVYHATKAYLVSLGYALGEELAPRGVRVTTLCPGPVATSFLERANVPDDYWPRILYRSPERVARDGYEGLMRGRRLIVPGFANQLLVNLPRLMSRGMVLATIGRGRG